MFKLLQLAADLRVRVAQAAADQVADSLQAQVAQSVLVQVAASAAQADRVELHVQADQREQADLPAHVHFARASRQHLLSQKTKQLSKLVVVSTTRKHARNRELLVPAERARVVKKKK